MTCKDYDVVESHLKMTLTSMCSGGQRTHAVVVGHRVPSWADEFQNVDFLLAEVLDEVINERDAISLATIKLDKGIKYAKALAHCDRLNPQFVMFADADDLVSRKLAEFVLQSHHACDGFYICDGYLRRKGAPLLAKLPNFHKTCGTSHIVRMASLRRLIPGLSKLGTRSGAESTVPSDILFNAWGGHREALELYSQRGFSLLPVPFRAAIYELGTGENWSERDGIFWGSHINQSLKSEFSISETCELTAKDLIEFAKQGTFRLAQKLRGKSS